jgi:GT2 family glycosyltransferase
MLQPEVSIIIPAHNEGNYLRITTDAVLNSTSVPFEVIVVDDASNDGSADFLLTEKYRQEQIRLVVANRSGSSLSRNLGSHHARAETLVFLDAHCIPDRGWIEGLLSVLETRRDSMVTPCISALQNRSLKGYGVTTDSDFSYTWLASAGGTRPYEIPIACGACIMLSREVFSAVGGFDSTSIWGMEDIELSLRHWLMGHSVLLAPRVEVAHLFKERANFRVDWKDWVYNALRCALLHFDGSRLSRILAALESRPEVSDAIDMLFKSDVWERLEFTLARKRKEADWLCDKFSMAI